MPLLRYPGILDTSNATSCSRKITFQRDRIPVPFGSSATVRQLAYTVNRWLSTYS